MGSLFFCFPSESICVRNTLFKNFFIGNFHPLEPSFHLNRFEKIETVLPSNYFRSLKHGLLQSSDSLSNGSGARGVRLVPAAGVRRTRGGQHHHSGNGHRTCSSAWGLRRRPNISGDSTYQVESSSRRTSSRRVSAQASRRSGRGGSGDGPPSSRTIRRSSLQGCVGDERGVAIKALCGWVCLCEHFFR